MCKYLRFYQLLIKKLESHVMRFSFVSPHVCSVCKFCHRAKFLIIFCKKAPNFILFSLELAMEQSFDLDEIGHFANAEFSFSGECEVFLIYLRFVESIFFF